MMISCDELPYMMSTDHLSPRIGSLTFFTPNISFDGELLEDVEKPAWTSVSLSESCGSFFTRTSSMFSDSKTELDDSDMREEERDVPKCVLLEASHDEHSPQAAVVPHENQIDHKEADVPFSDSQSSTYIQDGGIHFSEDLRSRSSSTKTLFASPRSSTGKLSESPSPRKSFEQKVLLRRGSLYRERAPSENALDYPRPKLLLQDSKSHSLHDVSKIPSHGQAAGLQCNLSGGQSRDSGFIRSESLISLNGGVKNYDHVQSKVKAYIQNIKDADALRRKQRQNMQSVSSSSTVTATPKGHSTDDISSATPEELEMLVLKMKNDMEEKDRVLLQLQGDYNALLRKCAEAENRIDKLRLNCIGSSPSKSHSAGGSTEVQLGLSKSSPLHPNFTCYRSKPRCLYKDFMDSCGDSIVPSVDVEQESSKFEDESSYFSSTLTNQSILEDVTKNKTSKSEASKKSTKKEIVISAPLGPITKLYSSSLRLDGPRIPLSFQTESATPLLNQPSNGTKKNAEEVIKNISKLYLGTGTKSSSDRTVDEPGPSCHDMKKDKKICNRNEVKKKKGCYKVTCARNDMEKGSVLANEEISLPRATSTAKPIDHLPDEDPFTKVQRWQNSLSLTQNEDNWSSKGLSRSSQASMIDNAHLTANTISNARHNSVQPNLEQAVAASTKRYASVGLQTSFDVKSTSINSCSIQPQNCSCLSYQSVFDGTEDDEVIGIVPRLNLDGLSDERETYNDSLVISDCDKPSASDKDVMIPSYNDDGSLFSSKLYYKSHGGVKYWKREAVSLKHSTSQHNCHGCCCVCGKVFYAQKGQHNDGRSKKAERAERPSEMSLPETTSSLCKHVPQMEGAPKKQQFVKDDTDASPYFQNSKSCQQNEDQVVPSTSRQERSFKYVGITHRQGYGVDPHVHSMYVDLPCGTASKIKWWCSKKNQYSSRTVTAMSASPEVGRVPSFPQETLQGFEENEGDLSLLHCLEEMDEYASQMWAKTVSFLEVLENNKHSTPN